MLKKTNFICLLTGQVSIVHDDIVKSLKLPTIAKKQTPVLILMQRPDLNTQSYDSVGM